MSQFKRWLHRIPFAFALAVLLVMGWGAVMVSSKPYDGFEMNSRTGYIYFVDMHGPSSGLLNRADIIISIEGISFPTRV